MDQTKAEIAVKELLLALDVDINAEDFVFDEWLTGFFEGDGSVWCKRRFRTDGYSYIKPVIVFAQKELQVLSYIKTTLGSGYLDLSGPSGFNKIYMNVLKFDSQKLCRPLLELLSKYVVSTHSVQRVNNVLEMLGMSVCVRHKPTTSWMSGFWDADGYVGVTTPRSRIIGYVDGDCEIKEYKQLRISVDQKDRDVLDSIQEVFGGQIYQNNEAHKWAVFSVEDVATVSKVLIKGPPTVKRTKLIQYINEMWRE